MFDQINTALVNKTYLKKKNFLTLHKGSGLLLFPLFFYLFKVIYSQMQS